LLKYLVVTILFIRAATAGPFTGTVTARDSLPTFTIMGKETLDVRGARIDGRTLFPIDEVLRTLRAPAAYQDSSRRILFNLPSFTVRLIARNPFVVITDRISGAASLVQLPLEPRVYGERMYLPGASFPVLFRDLIRGSVDLGETGSVTVHDTAGVLNPFDITGVHVESRLNGYLMTIQASRKLGNVETWLKPDGWLFVTVEGARADTLSIKRTRLAGAVRKALAFQSPSSVQLTFKVAPDVESAEVVQDPASNNLFVTLRTRSELQKQDLERKRNEIRERNLSAKRKRWNLDVIVIDAGHGGKDPGTIGISKVYEKTVTLGISLKLGELIKKKLPGVKVVYTRTKDRFVELYRRTQIANEAEGKLFISIHCNSMPRKKSGPNGFEIYLLRPGKTDAAVRIASRENAVIEFEDDKGRYKQLTEEEFILVTMAQSSYVKYSELFAQKAVQAMGKGTSLKNGGVKQAGFYVLVGASMPNALVETGYLSNKKDERLLKSGSGQQKIAQSLFEGIKAFKIDYEKQLNSELGSLGHIPDRLFKPSDAAHPD
jgi:N-acetylmuramoyl-L-alanine amidase